MQQTSKSPTTTSCQRRLLIATVGALLAAGPLAAGESRWYLEGKLGQASVEADFGPPLFGWTVDATESAAAVEVGYTLHRYLGIQAGYRDLGHYQALPSLCPEGDVCPLAQVIFIPADAEISGVSLSAVPRWPVSERFSLYGKLGVLAWDADLSQVLPGDPDESFSGHDLLAGIGAQYTLPKGFGLLLEYERSDILDGVSLGASWRF